MKKIINLLHNTANQPFKFMRKIWVEMNNDSLATHNTNTQIKFKTSIIKATLCDYSDA